MSTPYDKFNEWRLKNLDYVAKHARDKYAKNEEYRRKRLGSWKKWREKNPRYMTEYSTKLFKKNRERILSLLGNKCMRCGFSDYRALQIDHINGGGKREMIKFANTNRMIVYYLKNPDLMKIKLQVLCANCNWIKRVENNECKR